jgi:hypothetical protein
MVDSLIKLLQTDYAFSFSFVVYLMIFDIFKLNMQEGYRYSQICWLCFFCFIYCVLYQFGSIRWYLIGLNNNIPTFDDKFWLLLELFNQIIHFIFLYSVKKVMKSSKFECKGDNV